MNKINIAKKYISESYQPKAYGNLFTYEITEKDLPVICTSLYFEKGLPLKIITAFDERKETGNFKIMYVFGIPRENIFIAPFICVKENFPSITSLIHEASIYERKIRTFFGINPIGHPDPRSLILHENWPEGVFPLRKDFEWNERPAQAQNKFAFRKIEGEGIYEIPVGPVHAGIIEPGHFRFSVAGEEILMLEPRLGYSHKGSEKLFETLSLDKKIKLSERISGDSSFSHSLAFSMLMEELAQVEVTNKNKYLRVIFSELERLANHFGDIGAIMIDTGFNFGGSQGARLREMIMQINEDVSGSRFFRGINTVGGVLADISYESKGELIEKLESIREDFKEVIEVAENSSSLLNRLEGTGTLDSKTAKDHGVVGIAGRAIGIARDARSDFPYAAYDRFNFEIATETTGDVYARLHVRIKEVFSSFDIVIKALENLPPEKNVTSFKKPVFEKNSYALSMTEGWRGDIVYLASTDSEGKVSRVDVRDPSFLNWTALGHAGKGNIVPDFPLINKSFNLSYSGNDL